MMSQFPTGFAVPRPPAFLRLGPLEPGCLISPFTGAVVPLDQVPDPLFAQGALGEGLAILPRAGALYAPAAGEIISPAHTYHFLGLRTPQGAQLLIHTGLGTVHLGESAYTLHIRQWDQVQAGQLLLEMNLQAVRSAGYNPITPVTVLNHRDFLITPTTKTWVERGEPLLYLERRVVVEEEED